MLNKTKIAISTAIMLTAASTAFAGPQQRNVFLPQFTNESPENRIGDNFPMLEQTRMLARQVRFVRANTMSGWGNSLPQFAYESPENRIGDNYPTLEQTRRPVAARTSTSRVSSLQVPRYDRTAINNY